MNSSTDPEDLDDSKSTFIDKLIGKMKSEFNKNSSKTEKNQDEESETTESDAVSDQPPQLKPEPTTDTSNNISDADSTPPKITKIDSSPKTSLSDSSTASDYKNSKSPNKQANLKTNKSTIKSNDVSTDEVVEDDESIVPTSSSSPDDSTIETKPRIVLTFRTEKSKSVVTSSYGVDKDNRADESTSPGRRSLRRKTNSTDDIDKKPEIESGLKRSARRRSKDCTESILQSAIARKEKSYNETTRPQRLTRRLKPTAKILANLEMGRKNAAFRSERLKQIENKSKMAKSPPALEKQKLTFDKQDKKADASNIDLDIDKSKSDEPGTKMLDHLHKKFKRKHKYSKTLKTAAKKTKIQKPEVNKESDSDSTSLSSHEVEADNESVQEEKVIKKEKDIKKSSRKSSSDTDNTKLFRRSHRKSGRLQDNEEKTDNADMSEPLSGSVADEESLVAAQPESSLVAGVESLTVRKCLCQHTSQIYITTSVSSDVVYCTALDSINNRVIGCNNVVSGELAMLRPSTKVPYIILCEVHRQRLLRHNCCPICGLFCTQGRFVQCLGKHQYHRDCQGTGDVPLCPHCGLDTPDYDVEIVMKSRKKPVFLPTQKCHYPSAKMTFQSKSEKHEQNSGSRSISPPLIPLDAIDLIKIDISEDREKYDISMLYDAVKENDCEKVAAILGSSDVNLSDSLPDSDGSTILHYASQEGRLAIVHMLLVAGAEFDVLDKDQNTPLMLAIQSFKNTVVRYLIKSGASITLKGTDGMSALHLAAKSGNMEACEYLLSATTNRRCYVNSVDDGGWTPLVWACEHAHVHVCRYLLVNGADPLLRDVEQNVALHWAAFSGASHVTEMLLNHGCHVHVTNAHGDSPLHIAARQDKYNCVLMLLARGANVHLVNKSGETPLDCCMTQPGDCYTAISLNVQLQAITATSPSRRQTILTNDISRGKEINPVQCINAVDDEPKPTDFVYVTENCITSDINIDRKITTLQSCQCEDRCTNSDCLCSNNSLRCWYDDEGKLSPEFNYADPPMLFECNPACRCNAITCSNRVVQRGVTQRLEVFRTGTGSGSGNGSGSSNGKAKGGTSKGCTSKGWGVRTLRHIPAGAYVCEYIGEIISDLDADQREDDSYLFDLDNRDGETYCIDARRYGNLARFVNHSCDPNLLPVRIYIDHQDLRFPRIAFFANRDIQADEELGFDYGEKFWIIKYKSFTCTCGYQFCKYSDVTIKTTLENYQKKLLEEQELIPDI